MSKVVVLASCWLLLLVCVVGERPVSGAEGAIEPTWTSPDADNHASKQAKKSVRMSHAFLELGDKSKLHSNFGPFTPRKQREQALRDIIHALNASNIPFAVSFGTALGIVRESELLEFDDDVDFLVMVEDGIEDIITRALKMVRADLDVNSFNSGDFFRVAAPDWGPADIYRLLPANQKQAHNPTESGILCERWDGLLIPSSEVFPSQWVQPKGLPGLMVPIPNEPIKHLTHFYGPDWRTPNRHSKGTFDGNGSGRTEAFEKQFDRLCSRMDVEIQIDSDHIAFERCAWLKRHAATSLLIPLAIAAWLSKESRNMIHSPSSYTSHAIIFAVLYMILSALSSLAIRQTRGSALSQTAEACLLLYAMKAAISVALLVIKQNMPLVEILHVLKSKKDGVWFPVWCNLALLGALFATYDTLSFAAFQNLPPTSSQLLLNCRMLVMVPLQWRLLGKQICITQFCALSLIAFAVCSLGSDDMCAFRSTSDVRSERDYLVGLALILGKVLLSGFGLVINEMMLKELPLTVDAQNLITYCFSILFLSAGMCVRSFSMIHGSSVENDMEGVVGRIFSNKWMVCSVMLMSALGITCAYLLKAFSAMEKEFMSQGVVLLLAIGQVLTPGEHGLTLASVESGLIIVLSCVAYRANDVPPKDAPSDKRDQAAGG